MKFAGKYSLNWQLDSRQGFNYKYFTSHKYSCTHTVISTLCWLDMGSSIQYKRRHTSLEIEDHCLLYHGTCTFSCTYFEYRVCTHYYE
jgi:hypothetical protein